MTRTTRRKLLQGGLALGCSVAASPWITPIAFASAPWDNRLVVIILRGAMDGLDVVRPTGERRFAAMRSTLGAEGLPLDDFFTLHPSLEGLLPLWKSGELGFVHAVSTPYRDKRSHFDGQDILEAGTAGVVPPANARDGWLNRLLQTRDDISGETAFAIGRENPLILEGAAPVSRWSPDAHLFLSPAARRLLEGIYHDDPLFRDAAAEAIELAMALGAGGEVEDLGEEMEMARKAMARPDRAASAQKLAAFAASR
ncbi:MAG: twin-arginine translocation pathway signal, partial [Alphaproteobacteria bacterium]